MTPDGLFADLRERPQWQDEALCRETDPEVFYPEKGGSTTAAKRVCMGCPVRAECLTEALERQERFGIWGGLSERERRKLARGTVVDVPVTITLQTGGTPLARLTPEQEVAAAGLLDQGWGAQRIRTELQCSYAALRRFRERHLTKNGAAA